MSKKFSFYLFLLVSLGHATIAMSSSSSKKSVNSIIIDHRVTADIPQQNNHSNVELEVKTKRLNAVYAINEPIIFQIQAKSNGTPAIGSIEYTLSNDGVTTIKTGSVLLENGKSEILWKQKDPMVLRLSVSYKTNNNIFLSEAAAAVSPFDIKTTATLPEDFKRYWDNQIEDLENIPLNVQLKSAKSSIYHITLNNIDDSKVHGYLGIPSGSGPFPAILCIPGAGVKSANLSWAEEYLNKGFLVISISVHDLPNGETSQFYKNKSLGELKNYMLLGREDRDTYYFRRVILGCIRAVDYLTSHPKWDKKHMIVSGSSQGGGLTLMTTGLDQRITAATVNVPALCEHNGINFARPSGWPKLVPVNSNGNLDSTVLKTASYYDAVNFAKYINVPMYFGVGLVDNICPPTTVFSVYNQLNNNKEIDISPLMGHDYSPSFIENRDDFIRKYSRK